MGKRPPLVEDDGFCFYCQADIGTDAELRLHVMAKHPGSVRAATFRQEARTAPAQHKVVDA